MQKTPASIALDIAVAVAKGQASPDPETTRQVLPLAPDVARLSREHLTCSLEQILLGDGVGESLQWLHDSGILAHLLPELEATVEFTQEMGRKHKDVWKHTKQVIAQAPPQPALRWAAMLHDLGKVPTRQLTPEGKVTFHGHAELGARMFDRISRRLSFSNELRARIRFLIQQHLRANQYDGSWTDSAVRRFDREMGKYLDDLLLLSRADITSARPHKVQRALAQIDELWGRVQALRELDSQVPALPSGLGNQIMEHFGIQPGRLIGDLKRALEQAVQDETIQPHQEAVYYLEFIEKNREGLGL